MENEMENEMESEMTKYIANVELVYLDPRLGYTDCFEVKEFEYVEFLAFVREATMKTLESIIKELQQENTVNLLHTIPAKYKWNVSKIIIMSNQIQTRKLKKQLKKEKIHNDFIRIRN
jgi:hypothetical protein